MWRWVVPVVILACLLGLVLICFGPALLQDRQFSYRDSGHYYYPLYLRVQQEWNAGRIPLWEPEENGGSPLLGNPTAAVLYPGKIVYFLPYAWGARLYVVLHTLLAFAGMVWFLRSLGVSTIGAAIGGTAYAFGAPIVFQYCNQILLVGAAWLPFGFRAVDRLVRLGRRWAIVELAVPLAMQTLGGDPQQAYLTLCCGGLYALIVHRPDKTETEQPRHRLRRIVWTLVGVALTVVWCVATLAVAAHLKAKRQNLPQAQYQNLPANPFGVSTQLLILGLWAVLIPTFLLIWRRRERTRRILRSALVLVAAAILGLGLTAAQLLPVYEFSALSVRAAEGGPHDIFPFSLEPIRAAELIWPLFFGSQFHGNRYWLYLVPPAHSPTTWVPTIYLGGLTWVLALFAAGWRRVPAWRAWLTAVAILSFWAALGSYAGPIWWARATTEGINRLGAHDPGPYDPPREDGGISDGNGSFYWLLASTLPTFSTFRYPSKMLTLTSLAMAALAGAGWDRVVAGHRGRVLIWPLAALGASVVGLVFTLAGRSHVIGWFLAATQNQAGGLFGPFSPAGATNDLVWSFAQATLVLGLGLLLFRLSKRWPTAAGLGALLLVSADLAVIDAGIIVTLPQRVFDAHPRALEVIEEAEKKDPSEGPYRVFRLPIWNPLGWNKRPSDQRTLELSQWERDTIQPKYALPFGLQYTLTEGVTELYDYWWFFGPFYRTYNPNRIKLPGAEPGQQVVYYPRRGIDMWGSRYFVLPLFPNKWTDTQRGYAAMVPNSESIFPRFDQTDAPDQAERLKQWVTEEDWQILRNRNAYPRAWVVHRLRFLKPVKTLAKEERSGVMEELLYPADSFWYDPDRTAWDPRTMAWVEADDPAMLATYNNHSAVLPGETVTVTRYEPQRVELTATLKRAGIVILADVLYPGWNLTVDGKPAPIVRTNRIMRGAAIDAGPHKLVYTFEPASFRIGGRVSLGFLVLLACLAGWAELRPQMAGLGHLGETSGAEDSRSLPVR